MTEKIQHTSVKRHMEKLGNSGVSTKVLKSVKDSHDVQQVNEELQQKGNTKSISEGQEPEIPLLEKGKTQNIGEKPAKSRHKKKNTTVRAQTENDKTIYSENSEQEQHEDSICHIGSSPYLPRNSLYYQPSSHNYGFPQYNPVNPAFSTPPYTFNRFPNQPYQFPNQYSRDYMVVERGVIYKFGNFVVHDYERFTYYNECQLLPYFYPQAYY